MDAVLSSIMHAVVDPAMEKPDYKWKAAIDSVLDIYLGKVPADFTFKGKSYTASSFATSLGINPDDYIELTSYSHHPFYSTFVLEVPDNWSSGSYYNVPLDELIKVMENSIEMGYTFAWDGDVSGEVSFSANDGIAKMANDDVSVSQEDRQDAFDHFITTDDHLMHITGLGKDETGKVYFLTKNSWGDNKAKKGYWWMSENYVRMNTIAIMVHKDVIPTELAAKLKLR
jgi:bleomycin hydrolase